MNTVGNILGYRMLFQFRLVSGVHLVLILITNVHSTVFLYVIKHILSGNYGTEKHFTG